MMANYGNYFPATYNSYYPQIAQQQQMMPVTPMQQQTVPQSSINWVQGVAGAKAFNLAPNSSALLMDSESDVFYLKSCDASGMPSLRTFRYSEIVDVTPQEDTSEAKFVTLTEFEKFKTEIMNTIESKVNDNGKYAV